MVSVSLEEPTNNHFSSINSKLSIVEKMRLDRIRRKFLDYSNFYQNFSLSFIHFIDIFNRLIVSYYKFWLLNCCQSCIKFPFDNRRKSIMIRNIIRVHSGRQIVWIITLYNKEFFRILFPSRIWNPPGNHHLSKSKLRSKNENSYLNQKFMTHNITTAIIYSLQCAKSDC